MDMTRKKFFLGGLASLGALGGSQLVATAADAPSKLGGSPNLRLGVLSDIHIYDEKQVPVFERALAFFRDRKADGVIIAGDMADRGLVDQLELVAKAWFKVFPENRRPDGQPIEKLFVYGNHDVQGQARGEVSRRGDAGGAPHRDRPQGRVGTSLQGTVVGRVREAGERLYVHRFALGL